MLDTHTTLYSMQRMGKTLMVRLTNEELELLENAVQLTAVIGDRGGLSSWIRRAALSEAKKIVSSSGGR